jgi:hypothetical protein
MGSLHGHITFYFVLALVLSSIHILAKAHKDFESESKAPADFQSLTKLAQENTLYKSSAESVLESKGAVDFQVLAKLTGKNAIKILISKA